MRHFALQPPLKYTSNRPLPWLVTTDWGEQGRIVFSLQRSITSFMILLLLRAPSVTQPKPFPWYLGLNQDPAPLREKPAQYSLNKGIFRCSDCIVNTEVQADGYDHTGPPADY